GLDAKIERRDGSRDGAPGEHRQQGDLPTKLLHGKVSFCPPLLAARSERPEAVNNWKDRPGDPPSPFSLFPNRQGALNAAPAKSALPEPGSCFRPPPSDAKGLLPSTALREEAEGPNTTAQRAAPRTGGGSIFGHIPQPGVLVQLVCGLGCLSVAAL